MKKKLWYAVETDINDADWSMGSWNLLEAICIAHNQNCKFIAEIDGEFDENGTATADPICTNVYTLGKDF